MARIALGFWLAAWSGMLLLASPAGAQSVDDAGLWTAWFGQGDLQPVGFAGGNLKWWFDGQLRFLDDADGFNQSLVRPGVGWSVSERSTVWVGYAWIHTVPPAGPNFDENRAWQQWTWSRDFDGLKISHRSRLEQRFVETGNDTGLRFRQLLRAEHDLAAYPNLSLVGWDELFFHLNDTDWGAASGFDQNRAFAGVGFSMDSRWRMEVGYLNQVIEIAGGPDRNNHILSLNFYWR
jgi:hypothetical protein